MRVISGTARGRRLKEIEGFDIRPTTDKTKESIFNIIQFEIEGRRALDLFAGTGQLGIEALSRGARSVVFVDQSAAALKVVRENLKTTGLADAAEVIQSDALSYLRNCGRFDIIFLDPPYDTPLLEKSLRLIEEIDILNKGGIIVCESRAEKNLPEPEPPYSRLREYKYGKIRITTFRRDV